MAADRAGTIAFVRVCCGWTTLPDTLPSTAGPMSVLPVVKGQVDTGVELVATSVTSNNLDDLTGSPPRTTSVAVEDAIKASNRHVKYLDFDSHGYSVLTITPQETQMDWYVTSDCADPAATSTW
jgi:hypothetical protein